MPSKATKRINQQLFLLDRHGLKQRDVARWIYQHKKVTGFSQPVISRLRKENRPDEKQTELTAYLEEMLDMLKANKLFFEAEELPSASAKKQIQKLFKLDVEEPELDPKTRRRLLLITIVGALLYFVGRQIFLPDSPNCPKPQKKTVLVAEFQTDKTDPFAESVVVALRRDLDPETYEMGKESYRSLEEADYYERIGADHFGSDCDRGLFLCGLWNKPDSAFTASILLYRLRAKVPGLEYGDFIFLENPPEIRFSIREDAKFLTDFVKGILKTYERKADDALAIFHELELRHKALESEQSRSVKDYLHLFRGQCYALQSKWPQSMEEYLAAAAASSSDIKTAAQTNLEILAEMLGEEAGEKANVRGAMSSQNEAEEPVKKPKQEASWEWDVVADQAGNTYRTISLAGETWLRDNLRINQDSSWCYGNDPASCAQYGRLYTWESAQKACQSLGPDWRLPDDEEWEKLENLFNGFYGFMNFHKALPLPRQLDSLTSETDGNLERLGERDGRSYFWSASKPASAANGGRASYYQFDADEQTLNSGRTEEGSALFCRCVRDNEEPRRDVGGE